MSTVNKGDWGYTDDVLLDTEKFDTEAIRCVKNDRIKGVIWADQDGKARIFQGKSETETDDYVTEIAFSACVNPGDAEAFTIDCVGLFCRIEIENDSGTDYTEMRLSWKLTTNVH